MKTNKALEVAREIAECAVFPNTVGTSKLMEMSYFRDVSSIIDQALQSERELADKLAEALEYTVQFVPESAEALAAYKQHREAR